MVPNIESRFRLVPKSTALDDLERHFTHYHCCTIFYSSFEAPYIQRRL